MKPHGRFSPGSVVMINLNQTVKEHFREPFHFRLELYCPFGQNNTSIHKRWTIFLWNVIDQYPPTEFTSNNENTKYYIVLLQVHSIEAISKYKADYVARIARAIIRGWNRSRTDPLNFQRTQAKVTCTSSFRAANATFARTRVCLGFAGLSLK